MITTETTGDGRDALVIASGAVTIVEAAALRDALLEAMRLHAAVTVDLSGAGEVDLACMQVLLAAQAARKGQSAQGGSLCITGLGATLARAFEDAGFPRMS